MRRRFLALLLVFALLASLAGCGGLPFGSLVQQEKDEGSENAGWSGLPGNKNEDPNGNEEGTSVATKRPGFLQAIELAYDSTLQPSASSYTVAPDFSNVINYDEFYFDDAEQEMLRENGFVVTKGYDEEFFGIYEWNRYVYTPNFVTTDAMMHTYHLFFSRLLKGVEREYFRQDLARISAIMQEVSMEQLEALRGTPWESAARRNLAYFSVGGMLVDGEMTVPSEVADVVEQELSLIESAGGISYSPVMNMDNDSQMMEDYSQYIPRGYYAGDSTLSRYFKAMMWYGRLSFLAQQEDLSRSALLMTIGLEGSEAMPLWERIYTITSFFVGASDDPGIYEYDAVICEAYGGLPTCAELAGKTEEWRSFMAALAKLAPPAINSIPIEDGADIESSIEGFRFMGQRFTVDAAIFQQLVYRQVGANDSNEFRMLPSALDIPAALGSDLALEILLEEGAGEYSGYSENMERLRSYLTDAPDALWESSLYGGWVDTLRPLIREKGEGYPQFMQSKAWGAKSLNTFLGSWTELKHDTVLYVKQVYAEMGGGDDIEARDDRGYVEPEPELFARLAALSRATASGLERYGVLRSGDAENLERMAQLAEQLTVIAEKELRGELPTDEEFELIRTFGGNLEHFWYEALKDEKGGDAIYSSDYPAAVVTDVATDPNGSVLEVGTGRIDAIYVIVDVGGSLRIAKGGVYSFYEFEQPLDQRLTDQDWRGMLGIDMTFDEDGYYVDTTVNVPRPTWSSLFLAPSRW